MRLHNNFQTNGTLLNEEWCRFFHENNFLIGLSLDGPQELHDAYRLDKGGKPTFQRVLAAARLLQQHNVEFNILTCVNHLNARRPLEVYRFLRDDVLGGAESNSSSSSPSSNRTPRRTRRSARAPYPARSTAFSSPPFSTNGSAATSERSSCRFSMSPWQPGAAAALGCASSTRRAGRPWRWNTTAMCIPATTMSIRNTIWVISTTHP